MMYINEGSDLQNGLRHENAYQWLRHIMDSSTIS